MDKYWPDTSMSESLNIERKTSAKNPTAELMKIMVKNAVKCTALPKGASVEDVCTYIESKYDMKVLKSCVNEALTEGVSTGTFQKVNEKYFLLEKTSRRRDFEKMDKGCPDPKLNDASMSESLNPDRKEGVCKHIEDNYEAKVSKDRVAKVLNEDVSAGTFGKINGEYFLKKETSKRESIEDMDKDRLDPKVKGALVKSTVKYLTQPIPPHKPNGAALEDVCKYIASRYQINMSKDSVNKVLRAGVSVGIFEKMNAELFLDKEGSRRKVFEEERFKMSEEKPEGLDKKTEIPTITREMIIMMVKHSIENLKKANGASLVDIRSYMEENYRANIKFFEFSVGHILNDMVNHGVLVRINGAGDIERFKIKESE